MSLIVLIVAGLQWRVVRQESHSQLSESQQTSEEEEAGSQEAAFHVSSCLHLWQQLVGELRRVRPQRAARTSLNCGGLPL